MNLMKKFKLWFLKEELQQLESTKQELKDQQSEVIEHIRTKFIEYNRCYYSALAEVREAKEEYMTAKKIVNEIVDVGVDVHMGSSGSWAVLCINGNPQYMKFVRFERDDIRSLQHFLKNFEYSKHVIDAPMLPRDFFLNWH